MEQPGSYARAVLNEELKCPICNPSKSDIEKLEAQLTGMDVIHKDLLLKAEEWLKRAEKAEAQVKRVLDFFTYDNGFGCRLTGINGDTDVTEELKVILEKDDE